MPPDMPIISVTTNQPLNAAFATANIVQFDHPALAIAGGELELLPGASGENNFVLAFGQNYAGEYTTGGGLVNQIYSDGVRVFQFTYPASSAKPSALNFIGAIPDPTQNQFVTPDSPFHRRDYTLKASIDSNGNRRLAAYGGVFKGGRMEGFLNPVFISPSGNSVTLTPNNTNQAMSQYATASVQLYDKSGQMMYTTFFGGISQYYWDAATNALKRDTVDLKAGIDGLPFINSVSTLAMSTSTDTGNPIPARRRDISAVVIGPHVFRYRGELWRRRIGVRDRERSVGSDGRRHRSRQHHLHGRHRLFRRRHRGDRAVREHEGQVVRVDEFLRGNAESRAGDEYCAAHASRAVAVTSDTPCRSSGAAA